MNRFMGKISNNFEGGLHHHRCNVKVVSKLCVNSFLKNGVTAVRVQNLTILLFFFF